MDQACEMYKSALNHLKDHTISFELGQIYAYQAKYDKALMYFSMSIDLASVDLLSLDPTKLAEYYMHRASVYEAIGLNDHSKMDLHHILEADPNFI